MYPTVQSHNLRNYLAIISHAIPCVGVLPRDGTVAAIDTAISESARNAARGPTNEDSII